LFELGCPVFFY